MTIDLTTDERDFIVTMALNSVWNLCQEQLQKRNIGDIEKVNLEKIRDECFRLMNKLKSDYIS